MLASTSSYDARYGVASYNWIVSKYRYRIMKCQLSFGMDASIINAGGSRFFNHH